jgi:hypothetical protein
MFCSSKFYTRFLLKVIEVIIITIQNNKKQAVKMSNKIDIVNFTNSEVLFIPKGFLYQKIDSSWQMDSIYLFVISPMSLIGFILNICCFFILLPKNKIKQARLYKYLRIYSFNSSVICFINAFIFFSFSPKYFKYTFEYLVRFYRCKIIGYFSICLYIFGNILDVLIALDRLSIYLNKKMDKFNEIKPYKKCVLLFLICLILNLPLLLSITVSINQDLINLSTQNSIYLNCIQTNFSKTKCGFIINLAFIFVRDIITFLIELTCVCLLFYYYKYATIQFDKYYIAQTRSFTMNLSRLKKKTYQGRNLLLMSIYSSSISTVMHTIFLVTTFTAAFLKIENSIQDEIIILIFILSIILKHVFNVLIFLKFNRKYFKRFC